MSKLVIELQKDIIENKIDTISILSKTYSNKVEFS